MTGSLLASLVLAWRKKQSLSFAWCCKWWCQAPCSCVIDSISFDYPQSNTHIHIHIHFKPSKQTKVILFFFCGCLSSFNLLLFCFWQKQLNFNYISISIFNFEKRKKETREKRKRRQKFFKYCGILTRTFVHKYHKRAVVYRMTIQGDVIRLHSTSSWRTTRAWVVRVQIQLETWKSGCKYNSFEVGRT